MLFDTSFFIHLSGRGGARSRAAALAFLSSHPDAPLYTSRICWAELAEGVTTLTEVNELLADYSIIEIDEDIAWYTSRVARTLKTSGSHIGDNDCWIAGTAFSRGSPLSLAMSNISPACPPSSVFNTERASSSARPLEFNAVAVKDPLSQSINNQEGINRERRGPS